MLLGVGGKVGSKALVDAKGIRKLPPELAADMAEYCHFDVERSYQIFNKLYGFIPDDELRLIDHTIRMFCDPVLVLDQELATEELHDEISSKVRAVLHSKVTAEQLMSNDKFAACLRAVGIEPEMKRSLRTGKAAYAFAKTDLGMQELLHHPEAQVRALAQARIRIKSTIGETRAQRFLEAGKGTKRVPVMLLYYGAHTGRWSGGNSMNMQNLPRQAYLPDKTPDPTTGRLRRSLRAPKGKVLVVCDSAQIEARVCAWAAGQADMLEVFRKYDAGVGPDAYVVMASKIFNVPIDQVTKLQRFLGKTIVLGLGFGMGHVKFHDTLLKGGHEYTLKEVNDWVESYRRINHRIVAYWKKLQGQIVWMQQQKADVELGPLRFVHEAIALPNGMFLRYPNLQSDTEGSTFSGRNGMRSKLYGGLMCENVVQALARIIIGEQMLKIAALGYKPVLMTHDEIVVVAPAKKGEQCLKQMLEIMSTPPEWALDLPLAAEGGFAENYSK